MLFREWLSEQDEEIEFDLVHAEEEHEVATICGNPLLNEDELVELGYEDIFDAVVKDIYYNDVTTVCIVNAKPSRVEKFQFYLAGY